MSTNSYRNYYDWLAPKLSSEERKALDVIYEAANSSSGPNCSEDAVDAERWRWCRDHYDSSQRIFALPPGILRDTAVDAHRRDATSSKPGYMGDINGAGCDPDVP